MTTLNDLFPSRYLCADDLHGTDTVFTIKRVTQEKMQAKQGDDPEDKPVIYFNEAPKAMVLNKTNAKEIGKLYGNVIEEWTGKRVTLYVTKQSAFGVVWDVIRIRPKRPEAAPKPTNGNGTHQPSIDRPARHDTRVTEGMTTKQELVELMERQVEGAKVIEFALPWPSIVHGWTMADVRYALEHNADAIEAELERQDRQQQETVAGEGGNVPSYATIPNYVGGELQTDGEPF